MFFESPSHPSPAPAHSPKFPVAVSPRSLQQWCGTWRAKAPIFHMNRSHLIIPNCFCLWWFCPLFGVGIRIWVCITTWYWPDVLALSPLPSYALSLLVHLPVIQVKTTTVTSSSSSPLQILTRTPHLFSLLAGEHAELELQRGMRFMTEKH